MQLIVLHQNSLHSVVYGNSYVECTVIRNNTSKPDSFAYLKALKGFLASEKWLLLANKEHLFYKVFSDCKQTSCLGSSRNIQNLWFIKDLDALVITDKK